MKMSMFIAGGDFRGDYSAEATYRRNDIVRFAGHAYQAIVDDFSEIEPADGAYWRTMINGPIYSGISAETGVSASITTSTGVAAGTRKYWFGQEWVLEKTAARSVRLKKVYMNCNCNCNCVQNCDSVANQPNCQNCSYDAGDGLACNCACLFQSHCNYASGACNCTPNCADGNCYY